MSEILKYVLVSDANVEADYEFDNYQDAVNEAGKFRAVICRTYVYDDSELVYTPDESLVWPPSWYLRQGDHREANQKAEEI